MTERSRGGNCEWQNLMNIAFVDEKVDRYRLKSDSITIARHIFPFKRQHDDLFKVELYTIIVWVSMHARKTAIKNN